jgi:superfamily II DNA or RNA helicase
MNLATLFKLQSSVAPEIRQRAISYVDDVRIIPDVDHEDALEAEVIGTNLYAVAMKRKGDTLRLQCTCPYFQGESEICKHLWATLMRLERDRNPFADDVAHLVPATLIDPEDLDVPMRPVFSPRPVPPRVSRWRELTRVIASAAPSIATPPVPAEGVLLYVINVQRSAAHVEIELWRRMPKKDGILGAPKAMTLTFDELPLLPEEDRALISPLLGARRYAFGNDMLGNIVLAWPASQFVLRSLAATGRLHLVHRKEMSEPLEFDDGAPWTLTIDLLPSQHGYDVRGSLLRDGEKMGIEEPLILTPGGLAITESAIHLWEDRGGYAWANVLRSSPFDVPETEVRDFVQAVAVSPSRPRWNVPKELEWTERRIEPIPVLQVDTRADPLRARAVFDYDGALVDRNDPAVPIFGKVVIVRDRTAEELRLEQLWSLQFRSNWGGIQVTSRQFQNALPALLSSGWRVERDGTAYATPGNLKLRVSTGIDWFDLEGEASFGDQEVALPVLLEAIDRGDTQVMLPDGSVGVIDEQWQAQLAAFMRLSGRGKGKKLQFGVAQLPLIDALLASRPEVTFDEKFAEARKTLLDVKPVAMDAAPSFTGILRHYQRESLGWFESLRKLGFGGCLADDMGLGKTIQVLAMLDARRDEPGREGRPSIVVVPRSLIFNWKSEAARFTPQVRVLDLSTDARAQLRDAAGDYHLLLTTYGILRKDPQLFAAIKLDYAILDEAQAVKNSAAASSKAVGLLDARHRLALSGTPVENRVGDLVSIFQFLNPGMLSSPSTRVSSIARSAGGKGPEAQESRELLSKAVRPFVLRRTKAQVAPELPARVEKTIYCELSERERKDYDELRDHYRAVIAGKVQTSGLAKSKIHVLEALLRLRQAACHPGLLNPRTSRTSSKFEMLLEEVHSIVEEGSKAIIFSQFTSLLALLRRDLDQLGYRYAYLDGKTKERDAEVDRFQNDPTVPLFLISLKAGGVGLNLTAAEYVFLLDPWWNPAVEAQAIDRTHRIGQTRSVFAYRLVARDTIEEKILQLQASKRELAEAIISEDNSVLRGLTEEDLELLLS